MLLLCLIFISSIILLSTFSLFFKAVIMTEHLPGNLQPWQDTEILCFISQSIVMTAQTPESSNWLKFLSGASNNQGEREEDAQLHQPPAKTGSRNLVTTSSTVFSACCCISPVLSLPE